MKISDAKLVLSNIVAYNMAQAAAGTSHRTFIVPMLIGDPGVGKTAAPRQVARELDIWYGQVIIAQYDAGELAGLPVMNPDMTQMIRLRPSYLPVATEENGGVGIFNLDELPQAFLANQNIASQMVNEWRVGEHEIPHGITICCTGNKPENKAGTTTMPTHLKDRLMIIPIEPDIEDWLTYATQHHVDPRVRAFLRQHQGQLHNFKPGVDVCATPRSWEKASAILSMKLPKELRSACLRGTIGEGTSTTFEQWLRVEDKLPKVDDIIKDPDGAPVFGNKDADVLYLLVSSLADKATKQNIGSIIKYIERLPNQEFSVYCAHDMFKRDRELASTKEAAKWVYTKGQKLIT